MNRSIAQSEFVERIMQEHDGLREKVRRINTVLAQPEPSADEIQNLLREFVTALVVHFSNEEDEGFFEEIKSHAPHLADRAGKLCVEHRHLLRDANELCRFADAGSPSMLWWRELCSRCHEFSKRLTQHEHEESKLLQDSHQADICDFS